MNMYGESEHDSQQQVQAYKQQYERYRLRLHWNLEARSLSSNHLVELFVSFRCAVLSMVVSFHNPHTPILWL